jgi:excisionase family DNA binding protein
MKLITVKTFAEMFGVSLSRAYEMATRPEFGLPVVKLGRQVRLDHDRLEQWVRDGGRALEGEGGWKREPRRRAAGR